MRPDPPPSHELGHSARPPRPCPPPRPPPPTPASSPPSPTPPNRSPLGPRPCTQVTVWLTALLTRIPPLCADSSCQQTPQEGESCPPPPQELREHTEACADPPPQRVAKAKALSLGSAVPGGLAGRLRAWAQGSREPRAGPGGLRACACRSAVTPPPPEARREPAARRRHAGRSSAPSKPSLQVQPLKMARSFEKKATWDPPSITTL